MNKTELLNFLRKERELMNIQFYCNDFEFADRLLKFINSDANSESPSINENEDKKEVCENCIHEYKLGTESPCDNCYDYDKWE